MRMVTRPAVPQTRRTTSEFVPRGGMKSTILTAPSAVSKQVSRTSVPGRYRRDDASPPPSGPISQRPASGPPVKAIRSTFGWLMRASPISAP